jgi:hypothetical protein
MEVIELKFWLLSDVKAMITVSQGYRFYPNRKCILQEILLSENFCNHTWIVQKLN